MKFPDLIRSFTTQVLVGLWPFLCSARVQSENDLTLAAQRARHALENADWATAEREYLKIVRLLPNSAEASNNLGIVYHQQKRFPDAIARFQRALSLNPDMIGPNFFMGVDYFKLRKYASAIGALNKACKQDSENVEARLYLSGVHSAMAEFDQAIEILSALADKYKEDVEILQTKFFRFSCFFIGAVFGGDAQVDDGLHALVLQHLQVFESWLSARAELVAHANKVANRRDFLREGGD